MIFWQKLRNNQQFTIPQETFKLSLQPKTETLRHRHISHQTVASEVTHEEYILVGRQQSVSQSLQRRTYVVLKKRLHRLIGGTSSGFTI